MIQNMQLHRRKLGESTKLHCVFTVKLTVTFPIYIHQPFSLSKPWLASTRAGNAEDFAVPLDVYNRKNTGAVG